MRSLSSKATLAVLVVSSVAAACAVERSDPVESELRRLGVRKIAVGGTRKVTEELKLLPADRQIGQTGVRVQPAVLLAHVNLFDDALQVITLCFERCQSGARGADFTGQNHCSIFLHSRSSRSSRSSASLGPKVPAL